MALTSARQRSTSFAASVAVLSRLCRWVVTVERHPELVEAAQEVLSTLGYANVEVILADGSLGVPGHGPFDAISVTAMVEERPPDALLGQLTSGGALVCPIGQGGRGHLVRSVTQARRPWPRRGSCLWSRVSPDGP